MVGFSKLTGFAVAAACLISPSFAHPGETHDAVAMKREIHARNVMASAAKRSLGACSDNLEARNLFARNIARRSNVARELRQKRNIKSKAKKFRRDLATLETYEAINHNQTGVYTYTPATPETTVFAANTSCILTPEVTDGPYYVWGEMIRKNVKEDEYSDGVDLYLEVQYLDINTCQPVPNVYVDIWNANATGVYSGISESGNYAADGWNSTYLRGIQVTDEDGVASFETIFPGHYEGRATHTHLLAHMNVTVNDNGTLALDTGSVTHIGQLFWNEVLRSAVEDTYPYNTNTQAITTNADDMWSIVQAENDYDPFPEYLYLGDDVTDGLFAWIQIGVNVSADYTDNSYYSIAAYLEADGGHENESSGFTGGSGDPNSTTTVFEARLEQAGLLKRVVDAIKDLVQDCNFDCNDSGIALQAMDNSHVALVSMMLNADAFSPYRCDRTVALGINLLSLTKVLRAAQNEDILTLKAEDSPDVVNLMFESSETDRLSEYDIKLMDIDQEHLAIPETDYAATVSMPSVEFQRICRDLNALSESVVIEATKEGIKFSCQGDIGNGAVTIRQHTNVEDPTKNVSIQLTEPVALTFSLKYLVNFCKATALSGQVKLCLSQEVPLQVEYSLSGSSGSAASGHLRFFLAPKIGDEE